MAIVSANIVISFREFLECTPPGITCTIEDLCADTVYQPNGTWLAPLYTPEITLYCDTKITCGGNRLFQTSNSHLFDKKQSKLLFVVYKCKNCSKAEKVFALRASVSQDQRTGSAFKFGEFPAFGPPTPARVISLIGPQKNLFLKGRRAENQGMGIAAFAYYRRVIEDQKNRIFDEIIKVCNRLSAGQQIIDELTKAKEETQFSKAVDAMKVAIPPVLFISGHNPLTLLHNALSDGLHAREDEECLEIAKSIRIVMAEFAERMGQALKDEAELNTAVSRLLRKKSGAANTTIETNASNQSSSMGE